MIDAATDSFQFRLPLWYLVHRGTADVGAPTDPVTLGVSIGHILLKLDWGEGRALAMFTDEQLAFQFAGSSGMNGLLSTKVGTAAQFLDLLVRLPPDVTHLGFNPPPPGPGRGNSPVVPVAEVVATLRSIEDADAE